jgi:signal transduction histidine kinase/ligand-binding sensor domain-containing protein/DNA-binding response OmpR family regulator
MRFKFLFLVILFLVIHSQVQAEIKFRHLTVQDGLSRGWVKCITQDHQGYLWVGTADGLNKYDGVSFTVYKHITGNYNSLNHNNINVVFEDSKKRLWVGTHGGLNLYDRDKNEFVPLSIINNYISCIYEFGDGRLLIGSPGGLYVLETEKLKVRQIYNNIDIFSFLKDKRGNFWLSSFNGLMLLDTITFSVRLFEPDPKNNQSISEKFVRSLFEDSKGRIWVGTQSKGVCLMRYEKPESPVFKNFIPDPNNPKTITEGAVLCFSEDEKGNIWVGIENGGLNIFSVHDEFNESITITHLLHNPIDKQSLSNNSIHALFRDNQNTMWVGTYGNALSYHNLLLQKFSHFNYLPGNEGGVNNNQVNTFLEEEDYLWIGTENGISRKNKKTNKWDYFTYSASDPNSLSSNAVWSIFRDSKKNLWVGTWAGGLHLFNEKQQNFIRYSYNESDSSGIGGNNVYQIIEDRDGDLWFALMRGGLNKYNHSTRKFTRFRELLNLNSISSNWVNAVMESSDGKIWISTTEAIDVYDKRKNWFHTYTNDTANSKTISYNGGICFFEDSKKNIWIGTSNGLNLYNKNENNFVHYQQLHGLAGNVIESISEDNKGNLWLATNNGISKFLNAIDLPDKPVFENFDVSDGLQGNEFNSRAVFKNTKGQMYFGGNNGYNVFNPDDIHDNPSSEPQIVFTNLLVFNKPVVPGSDKSPIQSDINIAREIILSREQSVFTIEFAALSFVAPEKNQYAFYLEGFEKEWNYVGTQRSATYTNLDPGKYLFKVKASNENGIWNDKGLSIVVEVLPAWWESTLAKIFYVLLFIIAIYFFRKHTIISVNLKNELWKDHIEKEKSKELDQLKMEFFTNISHELRTPLTLIAGPAKNLKVIPESADGLTIINKNIDKLKNLVDQILDFGKIENNMMKFYPKELEIVAFVQRCITDFLGLIEQKNIRFGLSSNLLQCVAEIDEDKMEKIIANLISNAIKNTPENGKIDISLNYNNEQSKLFFEVADTGRGISDKEIDFIFDRYFTSSSSKTYVPGTGIGLNLTRKFVEMHGGNIGVKSEEGKGSIFTVEIPVDAKNLIWDDVKTINETLSTDSNIEVDLSAENLTHLYTVLVIDDNQEMCDYIGSVLSCEFNVIKETNPLNSIRQIIRTLPDVIISDVMMPGIDGFELCAKIKGDKRFSHIPVVLLTAKATLHDHISGFEMGADDYVYKPFDGDLLKARVRNLILRQQLLRQHFIGTNGIVNHDLKANALDKTFIDEILDTIKNQYHNPEFNVNNIIEDIGMSRSIFYKKFKALSDQSVNDLINNFRLKRAEELLLLGDEPVSDIAYKTGFSDPAYFSRVFKKKYDLSPSEFKLKAGTGDRQITVDE